jgi:hypothetical protein
MARCAWPAAAEQRVTITDEGLRALEKRRLAMEAARKWLLLESIGRDRARAALAKDVILALAYQREPSTAAKAWLVGTAASRHIMKKHWAERLLQELES